MAKRKTKKKSDKGKKESVTEYFEVEKEGKEKVVKAQGKIESSKGSKKDVQEYNKIILGLVIFIGILILFGLIYWTYSYKQTNFEYSGIKFKYVREGQLYFYKFQVSAKESQGKIKTYDTYTRKDPRKLEKEIPFIGNIQFKPFLVLNSTDDFVCNGDGAISINNLVRFYSILGIKSVVNKSLGCDSKGRYMYLLLDKGKENKIEQIGESCYKATIANCDILKVSERFLYKSLVEIKERGG